MEKPQLGENIYDIGKVSPTKDDADAKGNVLYYSPSLGWMQGLWMRTWRDDVTHWTYCPETPPVQEDKVVKMERTFNQWVNDKFPNIETAAKMLLRLGYEAGFNFTHHN